MRAATCPGSISLGRLTMAVMLTLAASGCAPRATAPPAERVTIGATTFPASAIVFVAEDQGYFEDEGLDAEVLTYEAGTLALSDAIEGKIDFASVAETPAARAGLSDQPFAIVATVAEMDRANYIIARRDRGIERASDLQGKRLGYVAGTSGDFFRHIYLAALAIDSTAVVSVELTPTTLVDAILNGEVDAVSTWPPFTSQIEAALGENAVILDEPGLYVMSWNVVASRRDGPSQEATEAFLRALIRAREYIAEHPEESIRIGARETGVDEPTLRQLWPSIRWDVALDQTLVMSLEDEARWMISSGGQQQTMPDFLNVIDTGPLRRVRPDGVDIIEPAD